MPEISIDPILRAQLLPEEHDHLKHSEARTLWAMLPYFRHREFASYRSVAAVAMIVNAARATWTRSDILAPLTQSDVLELANDEEWAQASYSGANVSLSLMRDGLILVLRKLGLDEVEVKAVAMQDDPDLRENFDCALRLLDPSCDQFMIARFANLTQAGRREARFAPIVSYSRKSDEVLLFDPEPSMSQPYWIPRETLLNGMLAEEGGPCGYLLVRRD